MSHAFVIKKIRFYNYMCYLFNDTISVKTTFVPKTGIVCYK